MKGFKTLILGVFLFLIIVSLAFSFVTDAETGENLSYKVKAVDVAPIVDGILDDPVWSGIEPNRLKWEAFDNISWNEQKDFDAQFYAVWRDSNLYLAIRFRDDIIEQKVSESLEYDSFDLYFDLENNGYRSKRYQYTIPVNENHAEQNPNNPSIFWNLQRGICELSFNLNEIPKKGKTIGFGIYYNDVDSGILENQISWAPEGGILMGEEDKLGKFVFDLKLKPDDNRTVTQWGKIKTLF